MEETWKRVGRGAILVVGAILTLIVVAVLVLQLPPIQQSLLDEITERTNRQLAGEVQVESLDGPILWRVTLEDVQVRDARGTPVAHVDQMHLGYSLIELLTGDLEIERVGMVRPLLLVRSYPGGSYNVFEVAAAGPPSEERSAISNFWIEGGAMIYEDRSGESVTQAQQAVAAWVEREFASGDEFDTTPVREMFERPVGEAPPGAGMDVLMADGVELESELEFGPGERQQMSIDELAAEVHARSLTRPLPLAGEDASVEFRPENREFEIDEMTLAEDAGLESLTVTMVSPPTDEEEARPADASFFREITGQFESFTVTPQLAATVMEDPPLGAPVALQATFDGTPESIAVEGRAAVSEGGTITFDGTVDATVPTYDITLGVADFRLDEWMAGDVPVVAFEAEGSLTGRGATFGEQLQASLDLTGRDITVAGIRAESLRLDARADGERVELRDLAVDGEYFGAKAQGYRAVDGDVVLSMAAQTAGREAARRLADEIGVDSRLLGRAVFELALNQGPNFDFGFQLVPTIAPQLPFFLRTEGNYADDYGSYALTSFNIGRPGWVWEMQDRAQVEIEEEHLEVASLVVEREGQTAALGGTYQFGDGAALETLFDKLRDGPLGSLLDLGALRRRFPGLVLDRPADELREHIPEDLEERLPGEIEERLPSEVEDFLAP